MEEAQSPSVAEQAANLAEVVAMEERQPAPEVGAEREAPRDEQGRFAPKRFDENELRHRIDLEQVKNATLLSNALEAGLVVPDDSMAPELWAKAFRGRMAQAERDGGHSTSPPPVESRTEESAEPEPEPEPEAGGADQAVLDAYGQRAQAFAAEHPDFPDVVGALELPPNIQHAVELAILAEPNGPAIAYELARNQEFVEDLSRMTPAQAAAKVGRLAEHLDRAADFRDQTGVNALFAEVPSDVLEEFNRKAQRLQESNPLSSDELELAKAISISPQLSQTIIAMGEPALGHYLIRHPHLVPRLNQMHPYGVAAELTKIQSELDAEADARPPKRLPVPITPTRKSVATDSGLSDNLPVELWAKRFRKKMGYEEA